MNALKMLLCGLAVTLPAILMISSGRPAGSEKAAKEEKAMAEGEAEEREASAEGGPQEEITNSLGMRLRLVPAGSYMMGAVPGDDEADDDEKPQHRVEITKAFYIGVYEVTQAQYEAVVGVNPSYFKGDRRPVECVSWNDAVEFCRKLSQREGVTYHLPTEAEWEYACRAGSTTKYYWGDSDSNIGSYAWYGFDKGNAGVETHEVGSKTPNAWELYDMSGNVLEWCSDWFDENYYNSSPRQDPRGPSSGSSRVRRGGCWNLNAWVVRSSLRYWGTPDGGYHDSGFRVVREVEDR
jgi:formylglycine-generating enzyme required for sulfatase activity